MSASTLNPESAGATLRGLLTQRRRLEARLLESREMAARLRTCSRDRESIAELDRFVAALDTDLTRLADTIHAARTHLNTADAPRMEQLLIVRCGEQVLAVPVAAVAEIRAWRASEHASENVIALAEALQIGPAPERGFLLVLAQDAQRALLADEIVQQDELEVRELGPSLAALRVYSGAAVRAHDELALVVDPSAL